MAAVPVTRTWVAGEVVTAPHFNDNIRDVLLYLLAKPTMMLRQTSAAQTLTTGTWTDITFNTEDQDSSGMHSTVSNTARATAVYPGWYRPTGGVGFVSNATGLRGTRWARGGTPLDFGGPVDNATNGNATYKLAASPLVFFNVGDYLTLQGIQTSGGNLNTEVTSTIQSFFAIGWESN